MGIPCYIKSVTQVSCQLPLTDAWLNNPKSLDEYYTPAIEPDVTRLISPAEKRRMCKMLRRAVATAMDAVEKSGINIPDAIITGTGMGCMENSEKFLIDMCRNGEECLKPTLFMQSTHNTVSSLIAILLKCHGYNCTYSHKGISFESALLDAWIQITTGRASNILVGAHDEIAPFMSKVMPATHPEFNHISDSSVSAVLSADSNPKMAVRLTDVKILHRPDADRFRQLLNESEDSVIMLGLNGKDINDSSYYEMLRNLPFKPELLRYKNVFGENFSSPSAGFYVAVTMLLNRKVPDFLKVEKDADVTLGKGTVTLINHSEARSWSIIRIKADFN